MTTTNPVPTRDRASCCPAPDSTPMDVDTAERAASVLKALSDPSRLRILSIVASHDDGEACVCDLTEPLGLQQPTVSHHLRILVSAGFLLREQRGTWAYYRLVPGALDAIAAFIGTIKSPPMSAPPLVSTTAPGR